MALTQKIPRNAPDPASVEATAVLAAHNKATTGRLKTHRKTASGNVPGGTSGTQVAGQTPLSGGDA